MLRPASLSSPGPITLSRISDGLLIDVNDAFLRVFGYTREDAIGRTVFELGLWRNPEDRKRMISALVSEGFVENLEAGFRARDGSTIFGQLSAHVLRVNSEEVVIMIGRDIGGGEIDKPELLESEFALKRAQLALEESELRSYLNESCLETVLRLERMTEATSHEITQFAIDEAVRLTQSAIGYVGFLSEDETELSISSWSSDALRGCRLEDKRLECPVGEAGPWGESVRQRRPVITNDYNGPDTLKRGIPAGHLPIFRHMSVPILQADRIVLVAGVANKEAFYDESDVRRFTLLMTGLWSIFQRKSSEKALRESEEKFFLTFKHAPMPLTITQWKDGTYLDVNDRGLEASGYTREEMLGRTPVELGLLRSEDRRRLIDVLERQGKVSGMEITAYAKEGSPIHCLYHCEMVTIGGVKQILTMVMDITERKRAEEDLMRLAAALEQAEEAIFISSPDWTIQYVNPAFERLTGYCHQEIVGLHTRILRSYHHDGAFYRTMRDTLARAGVWSGRIINRRKDGTFYEAEATASPVRDKSGAVINYVSIHRDITREVRLEADLQQARKMEAIGLLAGGIAHDFNNILAAIMGFTELSLLKISADSPIRENLDQVLKASERASEVVKQILTFTRQRVPERKLIGTVSIVCDTMKLLRSSLPSTIEICEDFTVKPGEDVVLADPGQINEVLMNLGANAGHAMKAKGGTLTVKLSRVADVSRFPAHPGSKDGPHLCLTVSDTGHGMDSAVLERIFDPYFTTKGPGEGTGLGLSVVQGIVKAHGGAITVRSEPGQGAAFCVFLPLHEDSKAVDAKVSAPLPAGNERILLVDDEKDLVVMCKEMLEMLGYCVTAKTSSPEALDVFRAKPDAFDLVITDMTMPHLTGKELTEKIIACRSDTPIILCTGLFDLISENQAKEAGVREFVAKPYEMRTLAGAIRRALGKG